MSYSKKISILSDLHVAGEKAAPELAEGQFTGYASTWTRTPDAYGDVIKQGAFTKSLSDWQAKGAQIPIYFGHNLEDPDMQIGVITSAVEDSKGLKITATLDTNDNEKAARTYKLLKSRRLRELSIGFQPLRQKSVKLPQGGYANEIQEIKLFEVSVVPIAANQTATITQVKSQIDATVRAQNILNYYDGKPSTITKENIVTKKPDPSTMHGKRDIAQETVKAFRARLDAGEQLTEEETQELAKAADTAKTLDERIKLFEEHGRMLDRLANSTQFSGQAPNMMGAKHLDLRQLSNQMPAAFIHKASEYGGGYGSKAFMPAGSVGFEIPLINSGQVNAQPNPPRLVDLLPVIGRAAAYDALVETVADPAGGATVVAPHAEKPVRHLSLNRVPSRLHVIAALSDPLDSYLLQDAANISQWVGSRLTDSLYDALETEILTGDGTGEHFTGLGSLAGLLEQAYAGSIPDTLAAAIAQLKNTGVTPSIIALSATDALALTTAKNSEASYYLGNVADVAASTVWGVQYTTVPGLPAGSAYLIGLNAAQIATDGAVRLDWDTSQGFTRNEVTARVEGRFNLDVLRPSGIVKIDLTDTES